MVNDLFTVENHQLVVNNEMFRGIPEFEILIKRDKSREVYPKELKYIWFSLNYKSLFVDLPDKEKHERVSKVCRLPTGWKQDEVIKDAMKVYLELLNLPASFSVINNLNKSLHLSGRIIGALNNRMEELINKTEVAGPDGIKADILVVKPMMDEILDSANKLPKTLANIELATDKFKKDMSIEAEKRGGGQKGNREDKDYKDRFDKDGEKQ